MYLWNVCVEKLLHCVWVGHADFIVGQANKVAYYINKSYWEYQRQTYRVSCVVREFPAPSDPSRPDTPSKCSKTTPRKGPECP